MRITVYSNKYPTLLKHRKPENQRLLSFNEGRTHRRHYFIQGSRISYGDLRTEDTRFIVQSH